MACEDTHTHTHQEETSSFTDIMHRCGPGSEHGRMHERPRPVAHACACVRVCEPSLACMHLSTLPYMFLHLYVRICAI